MKMDGHLFSLPYEVTVTGMTIAGLVDPHSHLREREPNTMAALLANTYRGGVRVVGGMPNTKAGLRTVADVERYRLFVENSIRQSKPLQFIPYLMITEETTPEIVEECVKLGIFDGKVYPFERTTLSQYGVKHYARIIPIVRHCGFAGMRVHVHPEHPMMAFSHRDAEFAFIPIVYMFLEETGDTNTQIWWEHGSDSRCIPHWKIMAETGRFTVTLCAHHLASNEDDARGDVASTCNPSIKPEGDRQLLCALVAEDHPWVVGISDSAFHDVVNKHPVAGRCSCGAYTAPFLAPLFAHALDSLLQKPGGIEIFQRFTSGNARTRCNLAANTETIQLHRSAWVIPHRYDIADKVAVPFWGNREIAWRILEP